MLAMSRGGMYDHVEGGFFRYSTARDWSVPHFEKMAEDHAGLLRVLSELVLFSRNEEFRETLVSATNYVQKLLRDEQTQLYAGSQDADEEYYALPLEQRRALAAPSLDRTSYTNWTCALAGAVCLVSRALDDDGLLAQASATLDAVAQRLVDSRRTSVPRSRSRRHTGGTRAARRSRRLLPRAARRTRDLRRRALFRASAGNRSDDDRTLRRARRRLLRSPDVGGAPGTARDRRPSHRRQRPLRRMLAAPANPGRFGELSATGARDARVLFAGRRTHRHLRRYVRTRAGEVPRTGDRGPHRGRSGRDRFFPRSRAAFAFTVSFDPYADTGTSRRGESPAAAAAGRVRVRRRNLRGADRTSARAYDARSLRRGAHERQPVPAAPEP